jgi:hypothetical protein
MERENLIRVEQALNLLHDVSHYSPEVVHKLTNLSPREQQEVGKDAVAELRKLAFELLEKCPGGDIDADELGSYKLEVFGKNIRLNRVHEFDDDALHHQFASVFNIYTDGQNVNPHAVLDALETTQVLHSHVFPNPEA